MLPIQDIVDTLNVLQQCIEDDFCVDVDDPKPGMLVTIATTDGDHWTYQTGDLSFFGNAYGHRHKSVLYLYRDSNLQELAQTAVDELQDDLEEEAC